MKRATGKREKGEEKGGGKKILKMKRDSFENELMIRNFCGVHKLPDFKLRKVSKLN